MLHPYVPPLTTKFAVLLPSIIPVASMLANQVRSAQLQVELKPMTDFVGQTLPKGATVGCRICNYMLA